LSLGLDTFAVALGLGLSGLPRAQWRRVGLTFAVFEGLMPVAGLLVGRHLSNVAGAAAGYIAGGLLIFVGVLAIREARDDDDEKKPPSVEGNKLFLTGLSVSLDELAVGFSLGILHVALGPTLVYIAGQAFVITFAGLALGTRLGRSLEDKAELTSGIVLTLLGVALLINQATGKHFL
jgi:putative Mn2+ efflux pump MntP